tara:strand:- start:98 stop:505 length:408 start_codon:yes stop_codon:yes gene_type:complete
MAETHSCNIDPTYGDWRLYADDIPRLLDKANLKSFLIDSNIQTVAFDQIAFKQNPDPAKRGVNCSCCNGVRYTACNTDIPPIISKDAPNIAGKAYRMLDGKHRIQKMIDNDKTTSKFFVINYDDIKQYFIATFDK